MAELISVNDFKPGITFIYEKAVYIVLESSHSKSARGQAHVKTKVKNLENNSTTFITFTGGDKLEKAFVEKKKVQFLFTDGKEAHFMDQESFEQYTLEVSKIKEELMFITENLNVEFTIFNGKILGVELPKNITLEVVETTDAIKGDTVTQAMKKAMLETNLEIDVPQFIKKGDKIVVSTVDKKYVSKT